MTDATGGAAPTAAQAAQTDAHAADAAAAKPLTLDALGDALKSLLPSMMNAALTDHGKRIERKFEARIAALTPAQQKAADAADGADAGAGASDDDAAAAKPTGQQVAAPPDPRIAALERQLAKLARDNEKAQQQAAQERRLRQEEQGHEQVRAALRGKVHPGVEDDVLDIWRARKAIVIGDDGATRVRFGSADEPEEGLDINAAVTAFLKTDKAKYFVPAPANGAQRGAGARPFTSGRAPMPGSTDVAGAFEQRHGVSLGSALLKKG